MKTGILYIFIIFILTGCTKNTIKPGNNYLSVTELIDYCRCNKKFFSRKKVNAIIHDCDNKTIKVKGYIKHNIDTNTHELIMYDDQNDKTVSIYFSPPYLSTDTNTHRNNILQKIIFSDENNTFYITATIKAIVIEIGLTYSPYIYLLLKTETDIIVK